jgi:hypothetical protein
MWQPEASIFISLTSYKWEFQSMEIPTFIEREGLQGPTEQERPSSSSTKNKPIAGLKSTTSSPKPLPTDNSLNTDLSKPNSTKSLRKLSSLIGSEEIKSANKLKLNSMISQMLICSELKSKRKLRERSMISTRKRRLWLDTRLKSESKALRETSLLEKIKMTSKNIEKIAWC